MSSNKTVQWDVDDPKHRITPTQQMLSSCCGALLTSLFVTPLDVVKIRLQAQQKRLPSNYCFIYCNGLMDHLCPCLNGGSSANGKNGTAASNLTKSQLQHWYKRPGHFTGTMDAFVKIARYEGVTSLWSGLSPTLVLALPATVFYFTTYEQLRLYMKDKYQESHPGFQGQPTWVPLMAGCAARLFSVTLVSPLEMVRTKMQAKKLSYLEVTVAVKELVQYHGFFSLWRGLAPTLLRDVPFSGIYWYGYEEIRKRLSSDPSFFVNFVSGAASGTLAAIVTLPFDVVKTHRQIELGEEEIRGAQAKKNGSTWQIMKQIYGNQGLKGLFAGIAPRLIKVAPACALMIASYEYGKLFFSRLNSRRNETKATV